MERRREKTKKSYEKTQQNQSLVVGDDGVGDEKNVTKSITCHWNRRKKVVGDVGDVKNCNRINKIQLPKAISEKRQEDQ